MTRISVDSIDDARLAPYRELNHRNLTRQSGLFIAEGDKVVERLIASRYPVASLLAEAEWAERLESQLPAETPIYVAEPKLLQTTIGFNFHRGVLACGRRLHLPAVDDLVVSASRQPTFLVCPEIHDPTNLGSIIRTAAAFGCVGIVLGGHCADPFSRRVLRVSMGAALHLPIALSNGLRPDGLGSIATLRHFHGLVERKTRRFDAMLVPLPAIDQLLRGNGRNRRQQREQNQC